MIALVLPCYRSVAAEKLYRWTDREGRPHITDYPPPETEKMEGSEVIVEEVPRLRFDRRFFSDLVPFLSAEARMVQGRLNEGLRFLSGLPEKGVLSLLAVAAVPLLLYLYWSLSLFLISRKIGVSSAWLSWVPAANLLPMVDAAGRPRWLVIPFILPLALLYPPVYDNLFLVAALLLLLLADLFLLVTVWMRICSNLWVNRWLALLIILPLVQLGLIGYLAFRREPREEEGPGVY